MNSKVVNALKQLEEILPLQKNFSSLDTASSTISCADSLCTEMIFLKNKAIAEEWLNINSKNREIFTLPDAVEFSARFFTPLIQ